VQRRDDAGAWVDQRHVEVEPDDAMPHPLEFCLRTVSTVTAGPRALERRCPPGGLSRARQRLDT
jgi:hypothetical protein